MKTVLIFPIILCIAVNLDISCVMIKKEVDKAYDDCLKKYEISVNDFGTSQKNLTCFDTCILIEAGIMRGKKLDVEKLKNYERVSSNPDGVEEMLEIIDHCAEQTHDIGDECELYVTFQNCIKEERKKEKAEYD